MKVHNDPADIESLRVRFLPRVGAYVVDWVVGLIFCTIFYVIIMIGAAKDVSQKDFNRMSKNLDRASSFSGYQYADQIPQPLRLPVALCYLLPALYFSSELLFGTTVGKHLFGMRVRNADCSYLDLKRSWIRWGFKVSPSVLPSIGFLFGMPVFLYLAAAGSLLFVIGTLTSLGPHRQALHDIFAGTAVYPAVIPCTVPLRRTEEKRFPPKDAHSVRESPSYDTW